MITTKKRAADLRRTLAVLRQLNPAPLEILITADGCTDDTVEMLKAEMSENRSQKPEGGKQKTDEKSQRSEVGGQGSEVRSQKSEGRSQEWEM